MDLIKKTDGQICCLYRGFTLCTSCQRTSTILCQKSANDSHGLSLFAELTFRSSAGSQLNRMDRAVAETNHDGMIKSKVEQETTTDVSEHNLLVLSVSIFRLCVSDTFQF
jgi:hypothetical protein